MASKQLVNDAIVSVSGRPLSYEQVLCRLPKLEIHEPSDDFVTNFDLKDNTDHTQLLVKISLEYRYYFCQKCLNFFLEKIIFDLTNFF